MAQVPLTKDDDMVKTFPPDRANQPFRVAILPWRLRRGWPVTNTHGREGLANDAAALILYRFAVAAVSAGTFSFMEAVGLFAAIVIGEIFWGIGVGWLMLRLRRFVIHASRSPCRS